MAGRQVKRTARHLAFATAVLISAVEAPGANAPNPLDLPPTNVLPAPVEISPTAQIGAPPVARPVEASGNPLWAIPLSSLSATRERPLFLPSRRAPAPAVAGPVAAAPPPPPPKPAEPEQPPLQLIGAIAGGNEGFAVFLDQSNNNIVRLRTGQNHDGWVLRSVKGREAILEKDKRTATLVLPPPGGAPSAPPMFGLPGGRRPPGVPVIPGMKPKEPEL